jgi:hypothetical protein
MKTWVKWAFVVGYFVFLVEYVLGARNFSHGVFVGAVVLAVVGAFSVMVAALAP